MCLHRCPIRSDPPHPPTQRPHRHRRSRSRRWQGDRSTLITSGRGMTPRSARLCRRSRQRRIMRRINVCSQRLCIRAATGPSYQPRSASLRTSVRPLLSSSFAALETHSQHRQLHRPLLADAVATVCQSIPNRKPYSRIVNRQYRYSGVPLPFPAGTSAVRYEPQRSTYVVLYYY